MEQLRSVQKTSKGAPAYSRLVNRRLGRVIAAGAYVAGRTPNQLTAVSAAFTFSGIALIALIDPGVWASVGIAMLLALGYGLDAADGQLARLRGGGSVAGEWLDHVVDSIKISTLHVAVLIGWFRFWPGDDRRLLVPIAFGTIASISFFVIILNDQLRRAHRGTTSMLMEGQGSSPTLYSLAVVPTDYGLLCWVFVLFSARTAFAWTYGALMATNAAFLALALIKWFREMSRYG